MKNKRLPLALTTLILAAGMAVPLTAYASRRDWGGPGYEDEEYLHDSYNYPSNYSWNGYSGSAGYGGPGYARAAGNGYQNPENVPGTSASYGTLPGAPGSGTPLATASGNWVSDSLGYRYQYTNGGWPFSCWQQIGSGWYYFNDQGYLTVGWFSVGTDRFYSNPQTGIMVTGWQYIGNYWYYFTNSGAQQKGWQLVGGAWYYLDPNTGALWTNGFTPDGHYVNQSGARLY